MNAYSPHLDWIDRRQLHMERLVLEWSRINSGSTHLEGLARMCAALKRAFAVLDAHTEERKCDVMETVDDATGEVVARPLGKALHLVKRPDAPAKVFLGGHMDTVFGKDHPFQEPHRRDGRLHGPGVADLKGGLVVMLTALQALERSPYAAGIGWEVVVNPDEEIGSPGSAGLLEACARRNQVGLLFEPALVDGSLAGARKGSGNFTVVMRGRAAHAGRDFQAGRNAIAALAEYTQALFALNGRREGLTVNPGRVTGGGAVNMVPDLAVLHFNARVATLEDQQWMADELDRIDGEFLHRDGIRLQRHGGFSRPPKIIGAAEEKLFTAVAECGRMLDVPITWQTTGGCCDGNNLAAAGLPNVDTLGVRGGDIHSDHEYLLSDSLVERARLSALLLMRIAAGEVRF
jgi:glutamate carboxypeptidase